MGEDGWLTYVWAVFRGKDERERTRVHLVSTTVKRDKDQLEYSHKALNRGGEGCQDMKAAKLVRPQPMEGKVVWSNDSLSLSFLPYADTRRRAKAW